MSGGRRDRARDVPTPAAFHEQFDEPFSRVLDLSSWLPRRDPVAEAERIGREVAAAVAAETQAQRELREQVLPLLADAGVPDAGVHAADPDEVIDVQRGLLFNGAVEACDGTSRVHDALPLSIYHLGIALVSYGGHERCWQQQLFRRDLRRDNGDPRTAVLDLLERRERRAGMHASASDPLAELARRGVMSYMERFVLTHEATAPWRMGHGSPAPMELVGTGYTDLVIRSIRLIRQLVARKRFVFVSSEQSNYALFSIGQALHPLEYAVVGTLSTYPGLDLEGWRPAHAATVDLRWDEGDAEATPAFGWVARFRDEVASEVVYGLYRATALSPPQVFYAHRDHVHTAARIALADSVGLEARGFPMLIDMADRTCKDFFSGMRDMAEAAYAGVGAPFCFRSERHTRPE